MTDCGFIKQSLLVLLACIGMAACKSERDPCLEPKNVTVNLHFYQRLSDTGTVFADTLLPNMMLNPLDGPAVYTLEGVKGVAAYSIRLSPLADSCRWYLQPDSAQLGKRDTLTFHYERRLHFISNACGYTYYYKLNTVLASPRSLADTIHSIDSVVINARDVEADASMEHVKIYFHR
jgi:hypothetical protein